MPSRARTAPGRRRGALRSFTDLRTGDIVVHEDHGVARFAGFQTRTVANITRDYLYLEYQGDDAVFVPTDQLAKISRYWEDLEPPTRRGPTAVEARRHALGDDEGAGAAAPRRSWRGSCCPCTPSDGGASGTAFDPDSDWQREFEERFPFTETADQREADRAGEDATWKGSARWTG